MRRGAWHQCGHLSQNIVEEQLKLGIGAGAVLSSKDIYCHKAKEFAKKYADAGGHVLMDQQFYVPHYLNAHLESYPTKEFRLAATNLLRISDQQLNNFTKVLFDLTKDLGAHGVIAPALAYEAARTDIVELNARLYRMAKSVGDALSIPTYATVVVGQSLIASNHLVENVLSSATALAADGYYYAFDFGATERIPSAYDVLLRCCNAGLTLACSGMPVMHAFAGPMSLLSLGFGAHAAGIGHFQTVWQFDSARWDTNSGDQGGGGSAPPRYFSSNLWGTIVYPDEVQALPSDLKEAVLTSSPFSDDVKQENSWSKFDSHKHLLYLIGKEVGEMAKESDPIKNAAHAINKLADARLLHERIITETALQLKDKTDGYQENWTAAMRELLVQRQSDFEYLSLI